MIAKALDINEFALLKQKELARRLEGWLAEFDFKDKESLAISAEISSDGNKVKVQVVERKIWKKEPIDRPLTIGELNAIARIDSFSRSQSELVGIFIESGNKPIPRRDILSRIGHIAEVNKVLKKIGLPFAICSLNGIQNLIDWDEELCFRTIGRA